MPVLKLSPWAFCFRITYMIYGILSILATGIQWAFIAVAMSQARRSVKDFTPFYIIGGSTSLLLIALSHVLFGCQVLPDDFALLPIVLLIIGGCFNVGANICVMSTLGYGASALYMALSSMGFAVSFLWSVVVMKDQCTLLTGIGITCLCIAVVLAAFAKQKGIGKFEFKRLGIAILATLCGGAAQICVIIAGKNAQLPALGKTGCIMLTYVVAFSIIALTRHTTLIGNKKVFHTAAITWGVLALTSYATLFSAIKFLSTISRAGIAWPIGVSIQMTSFTLYTRFFLKEKLSPLQITALIFIVIGIIAV